MRKNLMTKNHARTLSSEENKVLKKEAKANNRQNQCRQKSHRRDWSVRHNFKMLILRLKFY
jgi:hypothetical protein